MTNEALKAKIEDLKSRIEAREIAVLKEQISGLRRDRAPAANVSTVEPEFNVTFDGREVYGERNPAFTPSDEERPLIFDRKNREVWRD